MILADYVLLAAIAGYSLYLIFRKKKPTCCGDCANCHAACKTKNSK